MHEPRQDLFHLVGQLENVFVAGKRLPPCGEPVDGGLEGLQLGIFELESLRRRPIGVQDCGASAGDIEAGFGDRGLLRAAGVGDDDVGFAVHETAGFVGFDMVVGGGGCIIVGDGGEGLGGWGGLAEGVGVDVVVGVGGAVDGEEVGEGLGGVSRREFH